MPPRNSRQKKKSASAGSLALPRVHRVADADPPGSPLIALGRMHPSAEASGSTSLSRCRWASGGFRHRPNCRPKPCATGLELFNSTSRECPKTLRLPPLPCVGFGTWIAPSGWAARGSRGIRSVSSPFGFQRPLRESLAGGPPVAPRKTLRSTVTLSGGPPVPLRRAYRSAVTLPSRLCTSAARSSSRMRVPKLCRSPSSFRRPTSPSFSVARSAWSGDNFRS